jgi:hypothetical protein
VQFGITKGYKFIAAFLRKNVLYCLKCRLRILFTTFVLVRSYKKAANRLSKMYLDIKYYVILCTVVCACVCVFGATEFCRYPYSNWFTDFLNEEIVTLRLGQAGLYCGTWQCSSYEPEMKIEPRFYAVIRKLVRVRILVHLLL